MSNSYFKFKQFTVWHDKCAMKVGTDGVLLGAWVDVDEAKNILDVGAGTGLVSLMMAQRCNAMIQAVEIDTDAVLQANENISCSPWGDRIMVKQADFKQFHSDTLFDLIVSNPPYFSDSLKSPDDKRSVARHSDELSFDELICKASSLLKKNGKLVLIFPSEAEKMVLEIASNHNLFPEKCTYVRTKPGDSPRRVLLSLVFLDQHKDCLTNSFTIELLRHVYSEEYIKLTKNYYVKM